MLWIGILLIVGIVFPAISEANKTLGVVLSPSTAGTIAVTVAAVSKTACGVGGNSSPCSYATANSDNIVLTVTPATGYTFSGWSGAPTGACTGTSTTCSFGMGNASWNVTATFTVVTTYTLTVSKSPAGGGTVASADGFISCGTTCTHSYLGTDSVSLTATPVAGYTFSSWSGAPGGACTGASNTCSFSMSSSSQSVTANFTVSTAPTTTLNLTVASASTYGNVTSSPTGINCGNGGAVCSYAFPQNTAITLTANPATGYSFSSWSSGCTPVTGSPTQCNINTGTSASLSVTAAFTASTIPPTTCTLPTTTISTTTTTTSTIVGAAYCAQPPFIPQSLKPNLLLMLDNSFSMYDPAYYSTTSYNNSASGIYPGYDNSYNNSNTYIGYYTPTQLYEATGGTTFANDGQCSHFTTYSGTLPNAACTYINTSYLCLTLNAGSTDVTLFRASGNFLNWLAASKMDIQKQVLTGGKYDSTYQMLVGETRGWNGMMYLKSVNTTPAVTFGVRGPSNGKYPGFGSSDGGTARIDVMVGTFNYTSCMTAVNYWLNGGAFGQAKQSILDCFNDPTGGADATRPIFNHVTQSCWGCSSPTCLASDMGNGDSSRMENDCERYYGSLTPVNTVPTYANANILASICAISPNSSVPYVGDCYKTGGPCVIGAHNGSACDTCVNTGIADYCNGMSNSAVVDPTGIALLGASPTRSSSMPAFFMAGGILTQLGSPIKTYQVKVDQTVLPTGLIHDFYNLIKFGVMVFNTDGSASECVANATTSQIPCPSGTNQDGGKIISYINPSDDSTVLAAAKQPLIDSVNAITASTWTPYAEAFYNAIGYFASNASMRLNTTDFDPTINQPVNYTCRQNNILLVTDGVSTADQNPTVKALAVPPGSPTHSPDGDDDSNTNSCMSYSGSTYLDDLAWLAHNKKITDFTQTPTTAADTITTYTVFNGEDNGRTDECSPVVQLQNTATNGGGTYQNAGNSAGLQTALRAAFLSVAAKAASGTAASVLGEKAREGSNILQAVFYPNKLFNLTSPSTTITRAWLGYLNSLWFYEDSVNNIANIREDTINDDILDLRTDNVISFDFVNNQLVVHSWQDTNGDGTPDVALPDKTLDDVKLIWEGGKILFQRNLTTRPRKIFVNDSSTSYPKSSAANTCSSGNLVTFTTTNKTCFSSYLGTDLNNDGVVNATDTALVDPFINYVNGTDTSPFRTRTLPLTNPVDPTISNTWKLGDIIYSTPQIVTYNNTFSDYTVAYVGANDGMLHAFKVGKIGSMGLTGTAKAQITVGKDNSMLGDELWAFIPQNALPYLRYYADPNYCHSYIVDLSPYLYTYGSNKILIGGMRLGGGCGGTSTVNPPTDTCPNPNSSSCVGMSSYFALDVKDPNHPKLLWEFTDPGLKFTFSGPAVVNISNTRFVVFLSGPNDYNGNSNQNLKVFILKLNTDNTIDTVYTKDMGASYANSFGGRLFTRGLDLNEDGNTDYVFFGYSKYINTVNGYPQWGGGVVKLYTNSTDPTQWVYDNGYVAFSDPTGFPVTAQVAFDKCFDTYYLYFTSGKYFTPTELYNTGTGPVTLKSDIIAGVPLMCDYQNNCTPTSINVQATGTNSLSSVSTVCTNLANSANHANSAWYRSLDPISLPYYMERGVTDPVVTGGNYVMFVTAKPSNDVCSFSGTSRVWAFNCATGGAVTNTTCAGKSVNTSLLQGTMLLQLSTAAINQVNLKNTFASSPGLISTPSSSGMPPPNPPPITKFGAGNKIIHWLEK
ncbi:MAG: hypothetical protein HQL03_04610 [Nitrospirae bacterium]|nr:hypothetical protein [Nitrospirota bacterium]